MQVSAVTEERITGEVLLVSGVLTAAFLVCYGSVIAILARQWMSQDMYSFGMLVPAISAYLIWIRRATLQRLPIVPSLGAGGFAVIAAACLLLLGRLSAIVALQELSLVAMIFGLVLLILGWRFLRALWFPLAYLVLMLPVWDPITDRLHYPFQLLSARIGLSFLRLLGIPATLSDVYLSLPTVSLEIARACSGVNYLIAVLAIGIPLSYVSLRGWLPRISVVAFGIIVAFLSNGLRVAVIGAFSYYGIGDNIHGPGHLLTGLFVSMVGFLALLVGVALLARRYPHRPGQLEPASVGRQLARGRMRIAVGAAAALLVALAIAHPEAAVPGASAETQTFQLNRNWRQLPDLRPARFMGNGDPVFSRVYVANTAERVELLAIPFAASDAQHRLVYRSVDLPRDSHVVSLAIGGRSVRVNQLTVQAPDRETRIAYWYDLNGNVTASQAIAKGYTALQRLFRRLPPAKLIVISIDSKPNTPAGDTLDRFIADLLQATSA